jgi:hypothetical protein
METTRLFMTLLTELGGLGNRFGYKYVAPNGAAALQRQVINGAGVFFEDLLADLKNCRASAAADAGRMFLRWRFTEWSPPQGGVERHGREARRVSELVRANQKPYNCCR